MVQQPERFIGKNLVKLKCLIKKDAGEKNRIQGITRAGSCPRRSAAATAAFCAAVTDGVNVTSAARCLLVAERSALSPPCPAHLLPT